MNKKIQTALISVFDKDGIEPIVRSLLDLGVKLYSTGGTHSFIEKMGIEVIAVESITNYPSIFGGRVKTLHPKIFGGILHRRSNENDRAEVEEFQIPAIDLVIVDLYPFEQTVKQGKSESEIIEKIDIGGISLIRAAAKNFQDVLIVSNKEQYSKFYSELVENKGFFSHEGRKSYATHAFDTSSHYDTAIFHYFNREQTVSTHKVSVAKSKKLRYGENPHQDGYFYGNLEEVFEQIHGKEISYNNIVDIEASIQLIQEFEETTFAILKHNNACGIASRETLLEAYTCALESDPISAFGGVLVTNSEMDEECAQKINDLFFEVLIAPSFTVKSLEILKSKKNRILLILKPHRQVLKQAKSVLNGWLVQDYDNKAELSSTLETKTNKVPSVDTVDDLIFASKVCKHTKSNAIVLAKDKRLLASGTGQTSRVDALEQAILKARKFQFNLEDAVMASDAFFPFPDCVEIAAKAGITSIIQPGGSLKDQLSIDSCNENNIAMVFSATRHFKH